MPLSLPARPPIGRWYSMCTLCSLMFTTPVLARSAKRRPRVRSRVNTADARPKRDASMACSASSSEEIRSNGATGPKVSSFAMTIASVTSPSTVGSQ
jgi:hypothetical protein